MCGVLAVLVCLEVGVGSRPANEDSDCAKPGAGKLEQMRTGWSQILGNLCDVRTALMPV